MKKYLSILTALLLALVLLFSLTACTGPQTSKTALRIGVTAIPVTLNPISADMSIEFEMFLLIYDPLVRLDANQKPGPGLAESWEESEDGTVWTFHLNKNAKWHDGKPVTSADVKFTYETMLDNAFGYMYVDSMDGITSIECPDDYTVVFQCSAPKPNMTYIFTPILPKHIWETVSVGDLEVYANTELIGSGPYKIESVTETYVRMDKNTDYYGTQGNADSILFVRYDNGDSLAQSLMLGEIDAAISLSAPQVPQMKKDANVTLISGQVPGFYQISINSSADPASTANPLLADINIRYAMEYATDKLKIVDMVYGGNATSATSIVNSYLPHYWNVPADQLRGFNLDKAKEILDAAGYKDTDNDGIREDAAGNPLSFRFIAIADKTEDQKCAQIFASGCKEIGIDIKIETMDRGATYDVVAMLDYDMYFDGWGTDIFVSSGFGILASSSIETGINDVQYSSAEYDELYNQLKTETDEAKSIDLAVALQKILYRDLPYIFIVYDNNIQAYRSDRWTGVEIIPSNGGSYFYNGSIVNYLNIKPV